jgi:hypothetical protein
MRRGHLKQLRKPKRGKAAIWAEIQGQGNEVSKGRSVFKRSVNVKQRYCYHSWGESMAKEDRAVRQEIAAEYEEWYLEQQDWHEHDENTDDEEWSWRDETRSCAVFEKAATTESTVSALDKISGRLRRIGVDFDSSLLDPAVLNRPLGSFEVLQISFLKSFGEKFCNELRRVMGTIHLKPAPISAEVQNRFLDAGLGGTLRAAYHGTAQQSLQSIYNRGLLIPGQGNELRVKNGQAHGLGIYTAKLDSASLSWGFCTAPEAWQKTMLVCGVKDDAAANATYGMGNHRVTRESDHIRHVGSAMVIFDHRRVAPLFEVSQKVKLVSLPTVTFDFDRHSKLLQRLAQNTLPDKIPCRPLVHRRKGCSGSQMSKTIEAFLARRGARKRRLKGL